MNSSPTPVVLVPLSVVTVTSTVFPTVLVPTAGDVTVMEVSVLPVSPVPALAPKFTAVAPVSPVPVMVTKVPPLAGPEPTSRLVTIGWIAARAASAGVAVTATKAPAVAKGSATEQRIRAKFLPWVRRDISFPSEIGSWQKSTLRLPRRYIRSSGEHNLDPVLPGPIVGVLSSLESHAPSDRVPGASPLCPGGGKFVVLPW